jgi:mono/diheme cytochrome c family protein
MTGRWAIAFTACALAGLGCVPGAPHSTRSGVYTTEQAARGQDIYAGMCISCHAGMGNHTGPVFRARWGGHDLLEMYRFISENMPKNDPGTLSPDEYTSVMAFLLQLNAMPAGPRPLLADTTALKAIILDTIAPMD